MISETALQAGIGRFAVANRFRQRAADTGVTVPGDLASGPENRCMSAADKKTAIAGLHFSRFFFDLDTSNLAHLKIYQGVVAFRHALRFEQEILRIGETSSQETSRHDKPLEQSNLLRIAV